MVIASLGAAACGSGPEIQTPIGTFTVESVTFANEFPIGCSEPGHSGSGNCNRPISGYRFLVIEVWNAEAASNSSFADPIEDDMKAVEVVSDDGMVWESSIRSWRRDEGLFFVRVGSGSPESVTLHWPGNDPIALTPRGG
jgi:hypothetical protein